MTGPGPIIPDYVISTPDHLLNFTVADEIVYWGVRPPKPPKPPFKMAVRPFDQFPPDPAVDGPEDAAALAGLGYRAFQPDEVWPPGNYFMIGTVQFHWDATGQIWLPGRVPIVLINFINPSQIVLSTGAFSLLVVGSGFTPATVVDVDGQSVPTMFLSRRQVNALVPFPPAPAALRVGTNDSDSSQTKICAVTLTSISRPTQDVARRLIAPGNRRSS